MQIILLTHSPIIHYSPLHDTTEIIRIHGTQQSETKAVSDSVRHLRIVPEPDPARTAEAKPRHRKKNRIHNRHTVQGPATHEKRQASKDMHLQKENSMTYETIICIEIAGIRRGLRLKMGYHVEMVEGINQPILDWISARYERKQLPANWVFQVLGPRQRKELQEHMLQHWTEQTAA